MMWKRTVTGLGILFLTVLTMGTTPVWANGGPHGGYTDMTFTDLCAGCHRVHQGKSSSKLLKAETPYALCLTCHNGAGSVLNVLDGVKLTALQPVTGVASRQTTSSINISVAPYGETWVAPGGTTVFTVRVRNTSALDKTVALGTCTNCTVLTSPGTLSSGGVGYGTVSVTAGGAGTTLSSTIVVGDGTETANIVVTTKAENSVANATLNGGGFRFVNGSVTTSRHDANPADNSLRPWGYGGSGVNTYVGSSGQDVSNNTGGNQNSLGAANPLQCTSCHNPHGSDNYRLLKIKINNVNVRMRAYNDSEFGTQPAGFVRDEGCPGLSNPCTPGYSRPTNKYTNEYYGTTGGTEANDTSLTNATYGIATLCGACHTAYPSVSGNGNPLTGPALPTLAYDEQTANFTIGATVVGGTSFATGIINMDSDTGAAGTLTFRATLGAFMDNETITDSAGGSAKVNGTLTVTKSTHYRHVTEREISNRPGCGSACDASQNPETAPIMGFPPLRLASSSTASDEYVTCLTCHRVHGTAATMSGYALKASQGGTGDEDLTPSQFTGSLSTLLYLDNRGICQACHRW